MEKHSAEFSQDSEFYEGSATGLLEEFTPLSRQRPRNLLFWKIAACVQFLGLLACIVYILTMPGSTSKVAVWSPAEKLQSFKLKTSTPYFHNRSPYLGNDTERVDKLWEDLYDAGMVSVISSDEASQLLNKTRAAPKAPDLYLVQLQVFHDLHCLNTIRKWAYMDVYSDQANWIDGRIDHDTLNALHIDHCIDNLRQSIMCTNDISPRKFAPHPWERQYYVYPEIYTTQMCGNFEAVHGWSKERRVVEWMMGYDEEWERTRFNASLPDPER